MNEKTSIENIKQQSSCLNADCDHDLDSDDDGIPDCWEINGYTVENNLIVQWDDEKHTNKGFIKYKSDPYYIRSTGDPYSDSEKVLGKIDQGILSEAHHPLVAAYPKIGVIMNKMILSNNFNITNEESHSIGQQKSKTISVSTSSSNTEAKSFGGSISSTTNASLLDLGISTTLTTNFSEDWSSTITSEHSESDTNSKEYGQIWTKSLALNESEVAYLNGNVKYLNVGTAPIYDVRPTLNFVLGIGKSFQTIATIIAKSNTMANIILPNNIFPDKVQNSIAWNTIDDFNSQPIKLNYEQVQSLERGTPLQIQTIQTSGLYKIYNADMLPIVNEYQKWEHIMIDIYNRTACLSLIFENYKIEERRVSARKEDNYNNQTQPELTLGEAILIAFNKAKIVEKTISYKNVKFILDHNTDVILDKKTSELIENQIKENKLKNIFDIKLIQGMKIIFKENNNREIKEKFKIIKNETLEHLTEDLVDFYVFNKGVTLSEVSSALKRHITTNCHRDINIDFIDKLKITSDFFVKDIDSEKRQVGFKFTLHFENIYSESFSVISKIKFDKDNRTLNDVLKR